MKKLLCNAAIAGSLLSLLCTSRPAGAAPPPRYAVTDLGRLPRASSSEATALNDRAQVVGVCLTPVQNSPGTFDDRMIVVDASRRGGIRGAALPLLLDLARKPVFLHDDSVHSLDALLNPRRGANAPHPFYIRGKSPRTDVAAFLRSLDTGK